MGWIEPSCSGNCKTALSSFPKEDSFSHCSQCGALTPMTRNKRRPGRAARVPGRERKGAWAWWGGHTFGGHAAANVWTKPVTRR